MFNVLINKKMLLKNNEPWQLGNEERKQLEDLKDPRDKSAYIFMLGNQYRRKRKTVDKGSRRTHDIPRSFSRLPFYDYIDVNGNTVQIRYYETSRHTKHGDISGIEYGPAELLWDGSGQLVVDQKNKELAWFLLNHPRQATSPYRDKNKRALFYLEDKKRDAKILAKTKQALATVNGLIWGPGENKLSASDARQILMGYGHPNVSILSEEEVRVELDSRATKDEKAARYFITQTTGQTAKIKAVIQEATDLGIIKYVSQRNAYCYMNGGNVGSLIVSVGPKESKMEVLAEFLSNKDKNDNLTHIINLIEQEKFEDDGYENTPENTQEKEKEEVTPLP